MASKSFKSTFNGKQLKARGVKAAKARPLRIIIKLYIGKSLDWAEEWRSWWSMEKAFTQFSYSYMKSIDFIGKFFPLAASRTVDSQQSVHDSFLQNQQVRPTPTYNFLCTIRVSLPLKIQPAKGWSKNIYRKFTICVL